MVYVIMAWSGMGAGTGRTHVLLLKALQTATTAANRRRGRFTQPMVAAAAASRAAGGAMQLNAPRCRRLEQRSTGVTTPSGTGDAADASRSRWGRLQQPAVQRAAPCSSTHAPQTPGAADWASADSRQPVPAGRAAGARIVPAAPATSKRPLWRPSSSSPLR